MPYPVDKLQIINSALSITGNAISATPEDGSPEWNVASSGYDRALSYMLDQHNWNFASIVAEVQPLAIPPSDSQFSAAFARPDDCLFVLWVRLNDYQINYQVLNDQIVLGGRNDVVAGNPVTIKYLRQPTPDVLPPTFVMALESFVLSAIYRGLHEDPVQADKMWQAGERFMQSSRTRSDQEEPKRAFFNSRMRAARSIRRPWSQSPRGYGGTGQPGS